MKAMSNSPQKDVYVVLGMARSGTSAITRGLKALGIELGNQFGDKNLNEWNPKGVYEDADITRKINRGVSFALGDKWMGVHLIDEACKNNRALDGLRKFAADILKKRMESTQSWGFKDPRTCRILPFWQDIFTTLNLKDNYIIALRNPLASARSWHKLSGVDVEVGLLLWLMHLIPAIDATEGRNRIVVSYDLMLQDPRLQLKRIKEGLNISIPTDASAVDEYVNEFIDKKLMHHELSVEDLKNNATVAIAPICIKVYELLYRLAADEISFASDEFSLAWRAIKTEFAVAYPIYCYINVLLQKNKELEREIRSTHRSIPWKLIYPLRLINHLFYTRRRKNKEKRKLMESYGK